MTDARFVLRRGTYGLGFTLDFGMQKDDKVFLAQPVIMSMHDASKAIELPHMMQLSDNDSQDALQSMMDELWREGFRPKDIGTAGHLAATKEHLNDMRALVSKAYEIPLK